jgi:HEAT repeat protein
MKAPAAIEPLVEMLADPAYYVRFAAAWALGEIEDTRAVEPLIKALADADGEVRAAAAGALAKIGKNALDSLKAALEKETDEKIKEKLKEIIEKITKQ